MKKILTLLTVLSIIFSIACYATTPVEEENVVNISLDQLDEQYTFKAEDFTTEFATLDVGDLSRVVIVTLPEATSGTLKYNDEDISPLPFGIDIADITKLKFTPTPSFTGEASFTWRGKTTEASNPTIFTTKIKVTDEYVDKTVEITVYKNEEYTFKENDFKPIFNTLGVGDLSRVVITTKPGETIGTMKYNDTDISTLPLGIELTDISKLKFTPVEDYKGTAIFNWRGKVGTTSNDTIFITKLKIVERPAMAAKNKLIVTDKNTTVLSQLEADYADEGTFVIVTQPTKGIVSNLNTTTGNFQYAPNKDYVGADSFTFKVTRGEEVSNIATVSITVNETEDVIPFYYVDMQNNWANYSAAHLADMNIMIGEKINDDYFFNPKRQVTRAEFVVSMLSVLDVKPKKDFTSTTKFADDILIETWLKPYVYTALDEGIIKGSLDNGKLYFYPGKEITRAEAATIINNSIELKTNNTENLQFTDKDQIPNWSLGAIKNMVGYEIISGYTDNTFKPTTNITRAELAEMLYKAIKEKQNEVQDEK